MIAGIIAALITIIIGPFMFWIISHSYKNKLKKYPTQINDKIGDLVFLPLFNGMLVDLFILSKSSIDSWLWVAILMSLILTYAYILYQKNISDYVDWSKPKKGVLNFGGWYHATYMLLQIIIIVYGLIIFYDSYFLWGTLIGYISTMLLQIAKHGYI